ncbi:hypothetical protein ACF0H5_023975 [Mactra antiquata]
MDKHTFVKFHLGIIPTTILPSAAAVSSRGLLSATGEGNEGRFCGEFNLPEMQYNKSLVTITVCSDHNGDVHIIVLLNEQ